MIPNKVYLYAVGLLILWFLYSQFTGLIEDNAKQETEISNLTAAAKILGDELVLRGKLNTELNETKDIIESKNKVLQDDLIKLKTTPQQATCDITSTPTGYADRVLNREYKNNKGVP
jgi:hypothetical protein